MWTRCGPSTTPRPARRGVDTRWPPRKATTVVAAFRDALDAYERSGPADQVRIARWQIANVLRLKGQRDEVLALQLALERDAAASGEPDPYVYDELALLHCAVGDEKRALDAEARAANLRKQ
jgi:hypothetical protein